MTKNKTPNNTTIFGSLYQWALASCIVITLPLVFAIIYSVIEVTNFTQQSQKTLSQAVKTTGNSRLILQRLITMERSIRQHQVLNETRLFDIYKDHRNKFLTEIEILNAHNPNQNFIKKLTTLQHAENKLYESIFTKLNDAQLKLEISDLNAFDQLTSQTRELILDREKNEIIEVNNLSLIANHVRQKLIYSAMACIPLALLFGLIFVHLLIRPIKDISQAIRHLGETGFERPISIKGPQDLIEIGLHLEWLRERLNSLEHEKQQFIRNVSHELKTPLATLKEGTDLLDENIVGELNTEQQEIIQLMKLSNITINDLVENLLEYQKTIATQVELNLSSFKLSLLINRIIDEYQLLLRSKNITLKSNLSSVSIKADYAHLKTIISNVFSNALKFSPQNGTLGITLASNDNIIQLTIEDQGAGIDKKIQDLVFEDFYLGDTPRSWKIKGSGLGLALVKYYLDAHKGSIKLLQPNKKYCGARFSLQIPKNLETQNA